MSAFEETRMPTAQFNEILSKFADIRIGDLILFGDTGKPK